MTTFFILFTFFVAIATSVLIVTTWNDVKQKAILELQYINKMVNTTYAADLQQNDTLLESDGTDAFDYEI